jgi:RNA-directed DNA polymerase
MMLDRICSLDNLLAAFRRVTKNKGGPGIDGVIIKEFGQFLNDNLTTLAEELQSGQYQPQSVKRVLIPKPGSQEQRPLGIPTVRDRVVQAAVLQVIEPLFETRFAGNSYGFRPGRSAKDALRLVDTRLKDDCVHVVDADIKAYFDTIPHEPLLELVRMRVHDERVIRLIRSFLKAGVMRDEAPLYLPEEGTPQGGVISPLLANIYLDPLDQVMVEQGLEMVRYADDFVILCYRRKEAEAALDMVKEWMAAAGLMLHTSKTHIVDMSQPGDSFEFLGYHFEQDRCSPREKSVEKLKESVRGKTKRGKRGSLEEIIQDINQVLKGWFEYFRHSTEAQGFNDLDIWVAARLRNVMRRRLGSGRARCQDLWPDSCFSDQGLFSLGDAHAQMLSKDWS